MANHLQEIGHHAGGLMCMLEVSAPNDAQVCSSEFGRLAGDLAAALAAHLDCDAGRGCYADMEIFAPMRPKGAHSDATVDIFLDDMLCIAYETDMLGVTDYAQRYLTLVRAAATAIAKAENISVVATADTYDSIYTPFAVFGPAYEGQDPPLDWGDQTGDKWTHAGAYIDRGPTDPAEISANRRQTLEYYRYSPLWPIIEAKLSSAASIS